MTKWRSKRNRWPKQHQWRTSLLSIFIGLILYGFYFTVGALHSSHLPQTEFPAELYSNQSQDDLRTTFVAAMQKAKQSIILVVYSLTDSKIIQTLKDKAEEGIHVYVVYDWQATPAWVSNRLGDQVHITKRKSMGLMHQKILVIDEMQTWIGSANMTSESLRMHGNLVAAVESEPLAAFVTEKVKSLTLEGRSQQFPMQKFIIGSQTLELWFLPDNPGAIERILQLINEAKESIRVAMFTWTRQDLTQAIIAAKSRGVRVEVVIDQNSGKGASAGVVSTFVEAGVSPALSRGSALLHYKMMEIDDRVLVNGSANWTRAAFTQNDDCFIILSDLTEPQQEMLNSLWHVIKTDSDPQG